VAYGRCKSIYKYAETKSTTVSRHAKKVLRTDLPAKFTYSAHNYLKMAYHRQRIYPGMPLKPFEHGRPPELEGSSDDENGEEGILGSKVKRACSKKIVKEDKLQKTMSYEHHINFDDIREGEVVGSRVLLDN
jgi:hypothetical protein